MWEELLPPLIIGIITFIFYLISFNKNREKTKTAIKKSLRLFVISLPIFVVALILMGLLMNDSVLPPEFVSSTLGSQTGLEGILFGTLLGFPLPGPRYAIYPIANALYWKGAGLGTIAALICGQQIIDVPEGMFIEIKMLGTRFFAYRTLTAVIVVFIAGCITEVIFWFIPHGIPCTLPPCTLP